MFSFTKIRTAVVVLAATLSLAATAVPASASDNGTVQPSGSGPAYCASVLHDLAYEVEAAINAYNNGDLETAAWYADRAATLVAMYFEAGCASTREVTDAQVKIDRVRLRATQPQLSPDAHVSSPKATAQPKAAAPAVRR